MKNIVCGFTALAFAALAGCTQGTPDGPGTTSTAAQKPTYGQTNDTFNLSVPEMSSSLQQGAQAKATVGIKRAKNFDEDVTLLLENMSQGMTIEPASPVITHGATDAKITLKADDETPLRDITIKITGHPAKGSDAQVVFKLTLAAKDTFTLSVPLLSTSLTQGEKKTVSIAIKRDKSCIPDVALTFGDLATGAMIEPAAPVINSGDEDVRITLTAANDAALGNFTIKMTGDPTNGADAVNELKLTVVKR